MGNAKWTKVVLSAGREPRFGELCVMCGVRSATTTRGIVVMRPDPQQSEKAVLPSGATVRVPSCLVCRFRVPVGVLAAVSPIAYGVAVGWMQLKGTGRPSRSESCTERALGVLFVVAAFGWLFVAGIWASVCDIQITERADGIEYAFADHEIASEFAAANLGTIAE